MFYSLLRSLAQKVKKLQEEINDRKLAFNALSAKNALLEADITVSSQQHHDAHNEIKKIQIEKEHLINQIRKEYKHEKDVNHLYSFNVFFITSLIRNYSIFTRNSSGN